MPTTRLPTATAVRSGDRAATATGGRRLATIERISETAPIPGADAILRARVRGWDVVVRVGEFTAGDHCVYFEVDTLLDVTDGRFAFLAAVVDPPIDEERVQNTAGILDAEADWIATREDRRHVHHVLGHRWRPGHLHPSTTAERIP